MIKLNKVEDLESTRNICFNEDIIKALEHFKSKNIKFNTIYSDPDYNVNISYDGIKYKKKWDEYMDWYGRLVRLSLECLSDDGHLFLLNYPKQNSHLRVKYLDDEPVNISEKYSSYQLVKNGSVSEYVWIYNSNIGMSKSKFTSAHRSILHIVKSKKAKLKKENWWLPFKNPGPLYNRYFKKLINNGVSAEEAEKVAQNHVVNTGRMPYSWINENELHESRLSNEGNGAMYYDLVKNYSKDKTIHPCQIPIKLVSGLIQCSTNENDHVLIHFGGSGNELLECNNINRYFTSCEISKKYHKMIMERMSDNQKILRKKYKLMKTSIGVKT
tara:strand:+ start:474 stop:1457 length:984 start_codon:yes stop_codon:yes gene_type:complete